MGRKRRKNRDKAAMCLLSAVPNILTMLNLASGFLSIVSLFRGNYLVSFFLLALGFAFDMSDGLVARRLGLTSNLGVQLDSLADSVSFVVAPSLMVYLILFRGSLAGALAGLGSACFGMLRLAKFNITPSRSYFEGMSTPFFTVLVICLSLLSVMSGNRLEYSFMHMILIWLLSFLMVSKVRFPGLKDAAFLKYKIAGGAVFLSALLALFFGAEPGLVSLSMGALLLGLVFVPFIFSSRVARRSYAAAYAAVYLLFLVASSVISFMYSFSAWLLFSLPTIAAVLFSPIAQLALEKPDRAGKS